LRVERSQARVAAFEQVVSRLQELPVLGLGRRAVLFAVDRRPRAQVVQEAARSVDHVILVQDVALAIGHVEVVEDCVAFDGHDGVPERLEEVLRVGERHPPSDTVGVPPLLVPVGDAECAVRLAGGDVDRGRLPAESARICSCAVVFPAPGWPARARKRGSSPATRDGCRGGRTSEIRRATTASASAAVKVGSVLICLRRHRGKSRYGGGQDNGNLVWLMGKVAPRELAVNGYTRT
jgi:hypothetical protein